MVLLKRMLLGCLAAVWLMSLCACAEGRQETAVPQESPALVFEDALGREVVLRETPRRVAVLLGSFAEMWLLAGGEGSLIAVTQDAFDERGLELGEEVVNLGESHQPSLEALFAVEPDLVILSADLDGQLALRDSLEQAEISCAWCKVELFEDYLALLRTFTELLETPELYQKNGLDVQAQVDAALAAAPEQGTGPKVLLLRAYSSNVKAKNSDNTAGVMLRELGCVNIADSDSGLLEQLQMEIDSFEMPDKKPILGHWKGNEEHILRWAKEKQGSCFICKRLEYHMDRYFTTFFVMVKDPEFRQKVEQGKGFCMRHFIRLMEAAHEKLPASQREWFYTTVLQRMQENLIRVKGDIDWFVSMFDYRQAGKDWKNSRDAVSRGMEKLQGLHPADPPYRQDT